MKKLQFINAFVLAVIIYTTLLITPVLAIGQMDIEFVPYMAGDNYQEAEDGYNLFIDWHDDATEEWRTRGVIVDTFNVWPGPIYIDVSTRNELIAYLSDRMENDPQFPDFVVVFMEECIFYNGECLVMELLVVRNVQGYPEQVALIYYQCNDETEGYPTSWQTDVGQVVDTMINGVGQAIGMLICLWPNCNFNTGTFTTIGGYIGVSYMVFQHSMPLSGEFCGFHWAWIYTGCHKRFNKVCKYWGWTNLT